MFEAKLVELGSKAHSENGYISIHYKNSKSMEGWLLVNVKNLIITSLVVIVGLVLIALMKSNDVTYFLSGVLMVVVLSEVVFSLFGSWIILRSELADS